jgi:hypothetical protein
MLQVLVTAARWLREYVDQLCEPLSDWDLAGDDG